MIEWTMGVFKITTPNNVESTQNPSACSKALKFLAFVWFLRFDPLHQRDEREHSSAGRLTVWADHQHQLGGSLQVPHHHTPPHGLRQWGELGHDTMSGFAASCVFNINCQMYQNQLNTDKLSFCQWLQFSFLSNNSGLSSTWLQGIHCSTSVIFWIKVGCKVNDYLNDWLPVVLPLYA